MVTTAGKVDYKTRIQSYQDMLAAIEHTPHFVETLAKVMVHIEVLEDNFEIGMNGPEAPIPSDLFRMGDWFPIMKLGKESADD